MASVDILKKDIRGIGVAHSQISPTGDSGVMISYRIAQSLYEYEATVH